MSKVIVDNYYVDLGIIYNQNKALIELDTTTGESKYLAGPKRNAPPNIYVAGNGFIAGCWNNKHIVAYYYQNGAIYYQCGSTRWMISNEECQLKYNSYFIVASFEIFINTNLEYSSLYFNHAFKYLSSIIDFITWDEMDDRCSDMNYLLYSIAGSREKMQIFLNANKMRNENQNNICSGNNPQ